MTRKKGSILSSINVLSNNNAKNFLIFKNIYEKPVNEIFKGYFVNLKNKKIIKEFNLKTNYTNYVEINNNILNDEVYFLTNEYLGIPVYLSCRDKHLSFEHTHPPHEYILSDDKYKRVSEFKKEFHEIIS